MPKFPVHIQREETWCFNDGTFLTYPVELNKSVNKVDINSFTTAYLLFSESSDLSWFFAEKMGKAAPSVFSGARSGGETAFNTRSTRQARK